MRPFVVACAQIASQPNAPQANVEKAVTWIERAVRENEAELVILPEAATTTFTPAMSAEELWDIVAFVRALPDMSAAQYRELDSRLPAVPRDRS